MHRWDSRPGLAGSMPSVVPGQKDVQAWVWRAGGEWGVWRGQREVVSLT